MTYHKILMWIMFYFSAFLYSQIPLWEAVPSHSATIPELYEPSWVDTFNQNVQQADRVDIMFFGNSITWQWIYGAQYGAEIWDEFYGDKYPINLGISGDRTQGMLYRLLNGNIDFQQDVEPKVAVCMIGTNNIGWEVNPNTVQETADGIRAVLQLLRRKLPRTRILLLGIFPRDFHNTGTMLDEVYDVNDIIRQYADGDIIHYLDIGEKFLNPDSSINNSLMDDGLHPNAAGYRVWAESMDSLLTAMLAMPDLAPMRIMPLGNSITEGVSSVSSYRRYLDNLLRNTGLLFDMVGSMSNHRDNAVAPSTFDYDVDHEGHWSREADWILPRIGDYARAHAPDMVLMHLGTNDLLHEQDAIGARVERTIGELSGIIDTLRASNPDIKIALAQIIPTISGELTDPTAEVTALNAALADLPAQLSTVQSPVVPVDQYTGFDTGTDLIDNYHTNEPGAQKMAQKWFAAIDELLITRGCKDSLYGEYNPQAEVGAPELCITACKDSLYREYVPDAPVHDQSLCQVPADVARTGSPGIDMYVSKGILYLTGGINGQLSVSVHDVSGNIILSGTGKEEYNLRKFGPGVYFVRLSSHGKPGDSFAPGQAEKVFIFHD
ncbi:GDSL-type esterase/lipase family protein [Fibrobacterota bacterium]